MNKFTPDEIRILRNELDLRIDGYMGILDDNGNDEEARYIMNLLIALWGALDTVSWTDTGFQSYFNTKH